MSVLGILVSLGLLMWLAYRGLNVILIAPLLAMLAVLLGGDSRLFAMYTQVFMTALGGFLVKYFPLFLLGAVFGRLMHDSGSAEAIARAIANRLGARHAVLAVVLATAILTYGGVSLFVVAFTVYPVASALFRHSAIPKRLIPGALTLGLGTFTMTALPGTPSLQNAIPMPYFGTDLYAAPALGLLASAIMLGLGMLWLVRRERSARAQGEGYGEHLADPPSAQPGAALPPLVLGLAPLLVLVVSTYSFTRFVIPVMDTSYLASPQFGATKLDDVRGLWALIAGLSLATVAAFVLHRTRLSDVRTSLNQGTTSSLLPVFNTASEVGYGTVIASLAGFTLIRDACLGAFPGNPLVGEAIAVNVLAGITGSASGGLSIALAAMGPRFVSEGAAAGVSPDLLHRVATLASGGLDTLPHNGAVITLLAICQLTHRQSYKDIFVVSLAVPLLALAVVLVLGTSLGAF